MNSFEIDFFELQFLAEACIPPAPIARSMFFDRLIDEIYFDLSDNQRERMLESVSRDRTFQKGSEQCRIFSARYDRNNQYRVWTRHNGKVEEHITFFYENEFRLKSNKMLNKESIYRIEQIHQTTKRKLMSGDWVHIIGSSGYSSLCRVKWYRNGFYFFDTVLEERDCWVMNTYMGPKFDDSYNKFVYNGYS